MEQLFRMLAHIYGLAFSTFFLGLAGSDLVIKHFELNSWVPIQLWQIILVAVMGLLFLELFLRTCEPHTKRKRPPR